MGRLGIFIRVSVCALCFVLSGGLPLGPAGQSGSAPPEDGPAEDAAAYIPGEVLVKLRPESRSQDRAALQGLVAAATERSFVSGAELWTLGAGVDTEQAVALLAGDPRIEYAELNYVLEADLTPDDPRYPDLYGLHNEGQTGGTPGADISAEQAWNITTGSSSVIVGVIDSGVDYTHPDLAGNIWTNPGEIADNGIDDDGNGYVDDVRGWDFVNGDNDPMDDHGHGTHVSGTIGAIGNNQTGVVGVNWQVRVMPLKFLNASGFGDTAGAIGAVEYATMMGADLTNNSWGGGGFSQALLDAINAGGDAHVLFVAAAGNYGENTDLYPHYPSSYDSPAILSVAATDHNDLLAGFSNYGAATVDLGAPGVSTLSCLPGGGYGYKSGTSMATPHVAGAAALLRAVRPDVSIQTIKTRLMDQGDPIAALSGITVSGNRLNAFFSVREPDSILPGPVDDLMVESIGITTATLRFTAPGEDGPTGTATSYHIRYALEPLTEENFDSGTLVGGVPSPQPPGTIEHVVVDGLRARTTHHFAVIAIDEWGNRGPVSNSASATTFPGVPEIVLLGDPIEVESTQGFGTSNAVTQHDLVVSEPAHGGGELTLIADGDYGLASETATATAEGLTVGSVGGVGPDCVTAEGSFPLTAEQMTSLTADGLVEVEVTNSYDVNLFCSLNQHVVRLTYRSSPDARDFGQVFVGGTAEWAITVENLGNDVLELHSMTSTVPEFEPPGPSLSVDPGQTRELVVTFRPSAVALFNGTLHIQTNDPDEVDIFLDLSGEGLAPPEIAVAPDRIDEALFSGQSTTHTLTIANTGQNPLVYEIVEAEVRPGSAEGLPSADAPVDLPPSTPRYAESRAFGRGPVDPVGSGEVQAAARQVSILILTSNAAVSQIELALEGFPDVTAVDVADVYTTVPTLEQLMSYNAVIQAVGSAPSQADALGDVLADYVDAGGTVVMTLASFVSGFEVRGRLLSEGYVPFNLGSGPIGASTLGNFAADHPIMEGVTSASGDVLAAVTLADGAEWVADWSFGQPMIAVSEQGVVGINVYLGDGGYYAGDVPLILRNAALSRSSGPPWLDVDTTSGTVPPGGSVDVLVTLDATSLDGGFYQASLTVVSNDPDDPEVVVPVTLDVTGAPEITILGVESTLESVQPYFLDGDSTAHNLIVDFPPEVGSPGLLEVVANGDYGDGSETAMVTMEGMALGNVGSVGVDCTEASRTFAVDSGDLSAVAEDGVVQVVVQNSIAVNVFCGVNEHLVRLSYRQSASLLDFGAVFIGASPAVAVEIRNEGTEFLEVTAITSDEPDFVPSTTSLQLAPRTGAQLAVAFAPSRDGTISGTLTIHSNDPDEPARTIALTGVGVVPPDIAVSPTSIADHLFTGEQASHVLRVENTGAYDLILEVGVESIFDSADAPPETPRSDRVVQTEPLAPEESAGGGLATDPIFVEPASEFSFVDDFEDGDFNGWIETPSPSNREVTDQTAANGTVYSYHESDSGGGHFYGIYQTFGSVQPRYIRFFVRPGSTTMADGYFVVRDPAGFDVIWFSADSTGHFYINGDVGGHRSYPYEALTWYEIEFRDIDFTSRTLDYWVNGEPILADVPFRQGGSVQAFDRVDLYNFHSGAQAWWDEIVMLTKLGPRWLTVGPNSAVVPPGDRLDVTVDLDAEGLYGGAYHGDIVLSSNDPDEPEIVVPVDMQVTGIPDIEIRGSTINVESSVDFTTDGASTDHPLALELMPTSGGRIDVVAEGDFGLIQETATVSVEGTILGQVGGVGPDCSPATGSFPLTAQQLATFASDGVVDVRMVNSGSVNIICALNQHRVTLAYSVPLDPLDFGSLFLGLTTTRPIVIANEGTETLEITSIASDLPEFTVSASSASLEPMTEVVVDVTFAPVTAGISQGSLIIVSNDPDQPQVTMTLAGEGLIPPDIGVSPASISSDLFTNQSEVVPLTLDNSGGSDLFWNVTIESGDGSRIVSHSPTYGPALPGPEVKVQAVVPPPRPLPEEIHVEPIPPDRSPALPSGSGDELEDALEELNERFQDVIDVIPYLYPFSDGETGTSIADGGNDMYDGGNYLSTDFGGSIPYSNDTIASRPDLLGAEGRYFTRKYPGLFVFVADVAGLANFTISGNLGADGAGSVEGSVLESNVRGAVYLGFLKRVYGAGDPSVNHLIIVESDPSATHEFSTNTDSDYHRLTGISGVRRIHYLLYAGTGGALIDDDAAVEIMNAYLRVSTGVSWLTVSPTEGTLPAGENTPIDFIVDAVDLDDGDYATSVVFHSNDPDEPRTIVPVNLHVTGVPDMALAGLPIEQESSASYYGSGATTTHTFPLPLPPAGEGTVAVTVDGDFGSSSEFASVTAEALFLGEVGRFGPDCTAGSETFDIVQSSMATLGADGQIVVTVSNSFSVATICNANLHSVVLSYRGPADELDFGTLFLGSSTTLSVVVMNRGTAPLLVAMASDDPQFVAEPSLTVPIRDERVLEITFSPTLAQISNATLTLTSNDPDMPTYEIALIGEGLVPPDIALTPLSLHADLYVGGSETQTLEVGNTGGSDLVWDGALRTETDSGVVASSPAFEGQAVTPLSKDPAAEPPSPPAPEAIFAFPARPASPPGTATVPMADSLESVLIELDARFEEVNSTIPNRFDFYDGTTGTYINDGGNDMYDGGNYLRTNLGGPLYYTDGPIVNHAAWGASGRYFTKKYPGLFVMVADSDGVDNFSITGYLGADGGGSADGSVLQSTVAGHRYLGFVKRVYGAYDPSVNHLIILEDDPDANHEFATNTNDDFHRATNLTNVRRIHYLLYAGTSGSYIDDDATLAIMNAYLGVLPRPWLTMAPDSGVVTAGGTELVDVAFAASGLHGGDYTGVAIIRSNDPDEPRLDVPVTLHVTDAPDIELRGATATLESTASFAYAGGMTAHEFENIAGFPVVGELELTVNGDFGGVSEAAALIVEGLNFGQVGRTGMDCTSAAAVFPIPAPQLGLFLADSTLSIIVQNTNDVDVTCQTNQHTVRFSYEGRSDHLEYRPTFIGLSSTLELVAANEGTLDLNVDAMVLDSTDFVVLPSSLTVPPGGEATVQVAFSPSSAGAIDGTLTLVSDDPDEGSLTVPLSGVGVIPPDIDVSPDSMSETLLIDRDVTRTLTLSNTSVNGADLDFDLEVELSRLLEPPTAPMLTPWHPDEEDLDRESDRTENTAPANRPPEVLPWSPVVESTTSDATVLIVQDNAPWGSTANQRILSANGIAFDLIHVSSLADTNLSKYSMVLIPGDQTTTFYTNLSLQEEQLAEYVADGGTLEFHAAGWGWQSGNASLVALPLDVGIVVDFSTRSYVIAPHPIVEGVPEELILTSASHSYLEGLPHRAEDIVTNDWGATTLAVYTVGHGRVVAACQPLEYHYDRGTAIGLILNNMIPWVHSTANPRTSWLSPFEVSGIVASGDSFLVDMTFDATGLSPAVHETSIWVRSNDPDEPLVVVPATLNAVRLIAEAGPPQELECDGGSAAVATLDGTASEHMNGPADITDYSWYLEEHYLGSGAVLTVPIPLGDNVVALEIMDDTGATSSDETTLSVLDRTSPTGAITYPPAGACLGPDDLPVIVLDSYTDVCSESLIRIYDPVGGPVYNDHGDYAVTLQVSDPSGNPGPPGAVDFTIDVAPPEVLIHGPGEGVTVPGDLPFSILFNDDDDDGASGGVVHERVFLDDCLLYDGWSYGDTPDGLLRDDTLHFDLCRLFEHCGITTLENGVLRVEAIDCAGNVGFATRQIGGGMMLTQGVCQDPGGE